MAVLLEYLYSTDPNVYLRRWIAAILGGFLFELRLSNHQEDFVGSSSAERLNSFGGGLA